MSLQPGSQAPDFTLSTKTSEGPGQVRLSDHFGKDNVVLLFFPMAFTGVCTKEFCDISQGLNEYVTLGAVVYGISGDNPFALEEWATKEGIRVPLLSDYEHTVARSYGVAYDSFLPELGLGMGGVAKRSAFVIDKTGTIRHSDIREDARELPDFDKIKEVLRSLS